METMICIAVILVLWEIRELRNEKKFNELRTSIGDVAKRAAESVAVVRTSIDAIEQSGNAAKEFAESADNKLGVILREYEINGVPLGYERKPKADFVEGI